MPHSEFLATKNISSRRDSSINKLFCIRRHQYSMFIQMWMESGMLGAEWFSQCHLHNIGSMRHSLAIKPATIQAKWEILSMHMQNWGFELKVLRFYWLFDAISWQTQNEKLLFESISLSKCTLRVQYRHQLAKHKGTLDLHTKCT